jgi:hypothetical protein
MEQLTRLITSITRDGGGSSHPYEYDYGPRRRYHLVELPKFSGRVDEYPLFRQNLNLCLERERFRDDKDKALFVYNHLEGQARELVAHFMSPLSAESFTAILARLERTYGREQDIDRLLIRKLFKLPKLTDLSHDNLVHMVTVIEAALPALSRHNPEELRSTEGEKLARLLNLLPPIDADMFYMHCEVNGDVPNLLGFVRYLTFRCQARKARLPLPSDKPLIHKLQKPRTKVFYTQEENTDNSDNEEDDPDQCFLAARPAERPPCSLCDDARHDFRYCPKFKLLDINAKRRAIDTAKACSGCLNIGHFIKDCKRKKECTHEGCTRLHHPLLHDDYQMRINYFDEVGGNFADPPPQESEDQ